MPKNNSKATKVLYVLGGFLVVFNEILALFLSHLTLRETSLFIFAQGVTLGFILLILGRLLRAEERIAHLEEGNSQQQES